MLEDTRDCESAHAIQAAREALTQALAPILPGPDSIWLCAIYGSAAFGALGPNSDIDVIAEGDCETLDEWRQQAEAVTSREVNVASVDYMMRQPLMVQQIASNPIVLRDTQDRLAQMRDEVERSGRLRAWQLRTLGEALGEFNQQGPGRPLTDLEQRFIEALASVRNEAQQLRIAAMKDLEAQWATERPTRRIRNLLRSWPQHGNHVAPRRTLDDLHNDLAPATLDALRVLPYEDARADPVDVQLNPVWTQARELLVPVLDDLVRGGDRRCAPKPRPSLRQLISADQERGRSA